jgi:KDO2-lipid IV(A) lauroyltransferase
MKDSFYAYLFVNLLRMWALLPLRVNHALGAALGLLFWYVPNGHRRVALVNLGIAFPQLGQAQRTQLGRRFFAELGKTVTEMAVLWLWPPGKLLGKVAEVQGLDLLEQALQRGKGVMVLTPHQGAWELFGPYLTSKAPMTALYRPPRIAALDAFVRGVRERSGATLVPTNASGVKALRTALAQGQVTVILPDQVAGKSAGVHAEWFGRPALTMTLASRLAHATGATVLWGVAERLDKGRGYRIHFLPAAAEVAAREEQVAARAVNAGVEQCIALVPAQYMWAYKRYKHQPVGEVDPYAKGQSG